MVTIDSRGIYYRDLNRMIKQAINDGAGEVVLKNVNGQRYIGDGLRGSQRIVIEGTPGNDLAAYMDGLEILVKGNAQDGVANTMNDGTVVIYGDAGDTMGYAMRGGQVYVRGHAGCRVAIHMKEYQDKVPLMVIGGRAGDFLGEYMAGGILVVLGLGLQPGEDIVGDFCGTGMHGGVMYIRGQVADYQLGREVKLVSLDEGDYQRLHAIVQRFAGYFRLNTSRIMAEPFHKLIPYNKRPYGDLYAKA